MKDDYEILGADFFEMYEKVKKFIADNSGNMYLLNGLIFGLAAWTVSVEAPMDEVIKILKECVNKIQKEIELQEYLLSPTGEAH